MMIENNLIELNLIENTKKAKKTSKSQRACPRKRKKKKETEYQYQYYTHTKNMLIHIHLTIILILITRLL